MTFVILLAGIDLSVGSVIAVSGCISAGLISWNGLPVYVGILGGILAGVVIGLINGYIVSSTNIPAFIVTLAMMNIGRGIAVFIQRLRQFLFLMTAILFGEWVLSLEFRFSYIVLLQ